MPTINLNKNALFTSLRRKLKDVDLAESIDFIGPSVEGMNNDDVTVEIPPNRPDLLS